jgi:hypothetical protein
MEARYLAEKYGVDIEWTEWPIGGEAFMVFCLF